MARKSRYHAPADIQPEAERSCEFLAGIYARHSAEEPEDGDQNSIANQRKIAQRYIEEHSDLKFVDFYSDNGYSGMTYDRPDFHRLIRDLRAGRINCIIVKDVSRLGRHFIETGEYVESIFPQMGARLICVNDNYDSISETADSNALTMPLRMVMNDYYAKDISKKIRASIDAKISCGEYLPPPASVAYGYLRCPQKHTYDIDEEAAPVVRRIFEMRADGEDIRGICRRLNEEGIPSPGKLRFLRGTADKSCFKDALWAANSIRRILTNPVYLGNRVHGKIERRKRGQRGQKWVPEEDWIVVPNAHPAIVSQELYDRVRKVNEETASRRAKFDTWNTVDKDTRNLLKGKVFCAECGSTMYTRKQKCSFGACSVSYQCGLYERSQKKRCTNHLIRQSVVFDALKEALGQQIETTADLELIEEAMHRVEEKRRASILGRIGDVDAKRRDAERYLRELLENMATGLISRSEYLYLKQRRKEDLEKLDAQEEDARADLSAYDRGLAAAMNWVRMLKQFHELPELTAELVDALIDKIYIHEDRHLEIVLRCAAPVTIRNTDDTDNEQEGGVSRDG